MGRYGEGREDIYKERTNMEKRLHVKENRTKGKRRLQKSRLHEERKGDIYGEDTEAEKRLI